jgi:hypothetical protein
VLISVNLCFVSVANFCGSSTCLCVCVRACARARAHVYVRACGKVYVGSVTFSEPVVAVFLF